MSEHPARPRRSQALGDQLCFTLYAASRSVSGLYRPVLEEFGLTYPQYVVMLALWERSGVSVKELGAVLHLDYGTLSPLLKRLEAQGLLRRERRADDERSVLVELTDTGRDLRDLARDVPDRVGEAMGLSDEEFEIVRSLLLRLTTNVQQAAAALVAGPRPTPA
jgi:MarR family transcriptional regulator, organic hydroperoxide resistance regulator